MPEAKTFLKKKIKIKQFCFHNKFGLHFPEAMTNSVDGVWKVKFITLLFFVMKVFKLPVILFAIKTLKL